MVEDTTNRAAYAGNGSTSTAYVIPFRYDSVDWVVVTLTSAAGVVTVLEQVTDYTLAGDGAATSGSFTTTEAVASNVTVTVWRETIALQSLALPLNQPLPSTAVETALDRLAMAAQDSVTPRELEAVQAEVAGALGGTENTASILGKLQGAAADATRIGAEYMPEAVDFEQIVLADFDSANPPAGAIGLLGGELALGKGPSTAPVKVAPRRITGVEVVNMAGLPKSGSARRIVPIPILAAEMVDGVVLKISGSINFDNRSFGLSTQFREGFSWDNSSTGLHSAGNGWHWVDLHPDPAVSTNLFRLRSEVFFIAVMHDSGGGNVQLDCDASCQLSSLQDVYVTGQDNWKTNPGSEAFQSNYTEDTPKEVDTNLWLMVEVAASGGGNWGTAEFFISYDLNIEVVLP